MRALFLAAVLVLAGCASTEFQSYEGKNSVYEGTGGTKQVVAGVDFWENGDPPRKYKLLGVIDDDRVAGGISGMQLKKDIAKKAKEQGGDAVILLSKESRIQGYYSTDTAGTQLNGKTATTEGAGSVQAVRRSASKFAVVKYLN